MNTHWIRFAALAFLCAGLSLSAPAKFLEDAPADDDKAPAAEQPAPPTGEPGPGAPLTPALDLPAHGSGVVGMGPMNRPVLNRLLEIQKEINDLEARRAEQAKALEQLKAEATKARPQDKQRMDKQVREATAALHETIEQRQELMGQKARFYVRGAQNANEFQAILDDEIARLEKEAASTDGPVAPRVKAAQERLRLIKSIQSDITYLKDNPEALERLRQSATASDAAVTGSLDRRPRGPMFLDSEARAEWRPRWQQQGVRSPNLPPPNPQAVAQRLERLERELNFLRAQTDRLEREIEFLREWVDSQGKPAAPEQPDQEMKTEIE